MDITYKQNEMKVYKIVVQLGQMLKKMPFDCDPEWQKCLSEIEQQFQTRKFRMAVVGEFNRGKSSFINVLLGKRFCLRIFVLLQLPSIGLLMEKHRRPI